ncbi:transcription factor bHLH148-like [Cynara cardunculus var. scolymus]|uniref:Myc-type, basic helix-loop-helix (BHLH) domain-containing protein n=1 Tax=Cynara cardunculus var. scolymus TaxID=59895 RepID=A0A103XZI5_CYNCS|nr:transcription factor bHLH148-like [Cynara cardunculus var. scolymus]KVH99769.1 Myc-type, basic helix-loop-helix (bHLH) domain-containing protein [Cynara cardunculus var. scolymus]
MASPTFISDPVTNNMERARDSSKRRKKKKIQRQSGGGGRDQMNHNLSNNQMLPWKSEAQQQVYSSKLLQALRQVRISSDSSPPSAPRRGRAVREAADRVLAVTAKGGTRWSRAILTNKLKLKFMKNNKRQRGAVVTATGNSRLKKPRVSILRLKTKNLPAVQRKTHVLGRLVPGCRKQPLPVVLEEATDYIAALEMQVKAMAALANLLSGGGGMISQPPPSL